MIDALEQKRLIYVTGKGGVGKSTVAAAVGRALAARGRRTLLVETDAFGAMGALLDVDENADGVQQATDHLWTENLEASECFVRALSRFVPSKRIARAVGQNKVARLFFKAAPSVNEFVILDQITEESDRTRGGRPVYDHIVVDLPASGHAVTFLSVPQTLHGMMKVGPIADRAGRIAQDIADPDVSAVVAVCLPEEMPVNETIDLAGKLRKSLGRGLTATALNMVHPAPVADARRDVFEAVVGQLRDDGRLDDDTIHGTDGGPLTKLLAGNALAMGWYDRDQHYRGILGQRLDTPVYGLPVVYETRTDAIVEALADDLLDHPSPAADSAAS